jgi:hypothetical protein
MPNGKGTAWEYYTTKNIDEIRAFIDKCINYTYDDRLSIQNELVKNNSKEVALNNLSDIIRSIHPVAVHNLEEFM